MFNSLVGLKIGNDRLINVLGAGGFATVYLAENEELGRRDAVKVLNALLTGSDQEAFRNEARIIASLEHPHIIRVHDFTFRGETPCLIMEYAPKGSLASFRPRDTPLPAITIIMYIKQIAEALQYAHDQKIIHRDVKPANILMRNESHVLLADFGIALKAQTMSQSVNPESIIGTLPYMAPELFSGKPVPASDQYALGIVAYEWFSGYVPFTGSQHEIPALHMNAEPPSLAGIVFPEIEQVIMRALLKDPAQRFPCIRDFALALEQAFQKTQKEAQELPVPSATPMPPINLSETEMDLQKERAAATTTPFIPSLPVTTSLQGMSAVQIRSRYMDAYKQTERLLAECASAKQNLEQQLTKTKSQIDQRKEQEQTLIDATIQQVRQRLSSAREKIVTSPFREVNTHYLPARRAHRGNTHAQMTVVSVDELAEKYVAIESLNATLMQMVKEYGRSKQNIAVLIDFALKGVFALGAVDIIYWVITSITSTANFGFAFLILLILVAILVLILGYLAKERNATDATESLQKNYQSIMQLGTLAEESYQEQTTEIQNRARAQIERSQREYENEAKKLLNLLQMNLSQVKQKVEKYRQEDGLLVLAWDNSQWGQWKPLKRPVPLTLLGTMVMQQTIATLDIPTFPVFALCPGGENLFLETPPEAKVTAVQAIQAMMLRLLMTQRPGKLRFILIDPIGQGERAVAFLRLTDYSEELVGKKIWTKKGEIDQQLGLLSEHMEVVIQSYLRNQFRSIEEYNAIAGDIAEPYQILMILDFPTNFSTEAIGHLRSIFLNGPRCGISTLLLWDTSQRLPRGVNKDEFERSARTLIWKGKGFVQKDGPDQSIQLDTPAPFNLFNTLLKRVGEEAQEAYQRIEVPFRQIMDQVFPEYRWWTKEARSYEGLSVPLGLIGATRYQYMQLGRGTFHHMLIVGKTGSGKTNLLHVLITALALTYNPEELEFYLVDFKLVGFTPYATYKLPHARVVAIQSEREFGLSVLKGLDAELERRKRIFSQAGILEIIPYRQQNANASMPRILLVIDEFQELFIRDDVIAKEANELLGRLVRTGRALGIHVILCSQTLVGNHIIDPAILSQIAIRIVLQCEQNDYSLILDANNTKSKLLPQFRPGQAIYNNSNGNEAGNSEFQCMWLPENELRVYLNAIRQLAQQKKYLPQWQQNIFDGSRDSDISQCLLLNRYLEAPDWVKLSADLVWLGTPIAIQDPTSFSLTARTGANVLFIGQSNDVAQGLLLSALISLASQCPPGKGLFYVLDFRQGDVKKPLEKLLASLPHKIRFGDRQQLALALTEVSTSVIMRKQKDLQEYTPIYLFLYGIQNVRDLRITDGTADMIQRLYRILADGPEVRVHTLIWCDTFSNLQRSIHQKILQEFELRVVSKLSSEDSKRIMGSEEANTLADHRAFLYNHEIGRQEKFVPFDLPPHSWLEWVKERLTQKR